jgi:membrane-anchored protein YejM (alkaline phosphatase superfamily)
MKEKKANLYLMITAPGALLFSILNPSLAVVFIVPFVWYAARLCPGKSVRWGMMYALSVIAGGLGIVITLVRVILYNIGS